jgi:hypothetical protein
MSLAQKPGKHCGLMPLASNYYWIYQDSIFHDGVFVKNEMDTLHFIKCYQVSTDGLQWWQADKSIGLPELTYSTDSAIFSLEERLFTTPCTLDAKKVIYFTPQDSIRFLTAFEDEAAFATQKMHGEIESPAGHFSNCIFLEKYSPAYRKDQLYIKPGIGVIKYIRNEAPVGSSVVYLQQVSTLVKYSLE